MMEEDYLDKILNDLNFGEKYLSFFANRLTRSSVAFSTDIDITKQGILLDRTLSAINYIFKEDYEILRPNIICEVAKLVDPNINAKGFRRVAAMVGDIKISDPRQIYPHIYSLLDNYYNLWSDLDPYLRESYFHINFIHIHPFEDGNHRTARILTANNLYRNGETPFVILSAYKKEYKQFIKNEDYDGLADLFRKLAEIEDGLIKMRYDQYTKDNKNYRNK